MPYIALKRLDEFRNDQLFVGHLLLYYGYCSINSEGSENLNSVVSILNCRLKIST